MFPLKARDKFEIEPSQFIEEEIKKFVRTSPLNRMSMLDGSCIFDEPLVQFADGNDPIFTEYKTIIDPAHLTPREVVAKTFDKRVEAIPTHLYIISWILPITSKTRESNRRRTLTPSRRWAYTRWHGENFNDAMREHVVKLLTEMGYLAVAPVLAPYFDKTLSNEEGLYSNWSERHVAYAAGLGTFSLSDGFITERGIAHRCGSVVTDLPLPISRRTAQNHYSNCLFYANGTCKACIARCPGGAITERGHDEIKCRQHIRSEFNCLKEDYDVGITGCGLCQVKVPCEFRNPAKKLGREAG